MTELLTVAQGATAEITVKKSRFLALVYPITTEAAAQAEITAAKTAHPAARHHVFAYCLGQGASLKRASDDGEPSGTAGKPVLEVIVRQRLTNTLVIVVRYFGGILLGAPGLIRAYSEAAQKGLAAAGIITKHPYTRILLAIPYDLYGEFRYWLESQGCQFETTEYSTHVTLTALIPSPNLPALTANEAIAKGLVRYRVLDAQCWA